MKGCEKIPPPPSWTLSTCALMLMSRGEDQIDHALGFSPQKQNAKEINLSKYLQHVKAGEILVFNLKQYRVVQRVVTRWGPPESSAYQLFVALSKDNLSGPYFPYW